MDSVALIAPMHLLAADGNSISTWQGVLYGTLGTGALALITEVLRRGTAAKERAAGAAAKHAEGDSAVEIEHIRSIKDLQKSQADEMHRFRKEMNNFRIQDLVRIQRLEDSLDVLKGCYYGLFAAAQMMQFHWSAMRKRLRKVDPEFADSDYPDVDLSAWSPDKVFPKLNLTPNVTVNVGIPGENIAPISSTTSTP